MEVLQFAHGVIDPVFTLDEARQMQEQTGPMFRKIVNKIDELSGVDKEAIEKTEARFPAGGAGPNGQGRGELGADAEASTGVRP